MPCPCRSRAVPTNAAPSPRFTPRWTWASRCTTFTALQRVARQHDVSPQQVCLAWMLAKSPMVVPIPGASRPQTIRDSAAAV
ncbi:aldo/keto reductase [Micromonospora sp. NPDC005173]|uniref:aldo/keto reductase n=1 Tax=Micromonospora sp. NPDC005173 TaxID=3157165 RepID=UPI0033B6FCD7